MAHPHPEEIAVAFHITCKELLNENDENPKEVEHHLRLRLAEKALDSNWFILAINDHDEYFPNHIMLGISLGSVDDVSEEERRKNPLKEGYVGYSGGHIDP